MIMIQLMVLMSWQRCGKNGVAAEEVDLDLHGVAHPSEDVEVVPSLLVVVAGRIVVDANLVVVALMVVVLTAAVYAVEVGLVFGNEDAFEGRQLRHLFGAEVGGLVKHEAVAVAEDVGREPAVEAEAYECR